MIHDGMPHGRNQAQGQGHTREVDRQSPTGLSFSRFGCLAWKSRHLVLSMKTSRKCNLKVLVLVLKLFGLALETKWPINKLEIIHFICEI